MKRTICAGLFALLLTPATAAAQAQAPKGLGTEEFGMSPRELVQAIEKTEELIARCMREQGFQYVAADHNTVRAGMAADKRLPGLSEEEFVSRYGFGVSTFYTGLPPQLSTDYSPARVGLGERNVQIFRGLSPADLFHSGYPRHVRTSAASCRHGQLSPNSREGSIAYLVMHINCPT